ncbi:hypothetical protein LTS18_001807, partial [Coniosporium uncinatum]
MSAPNQGRGRGGQRGGQNNPGRGGPGGRGRGAGRGGQGFDGAHDDRCFNCGQAGHMSRECPKLSRDSPRGGGGGGYQGGRGRGGYGDSRGGRGGSHSTGGPSAPQVPMPTGDPDPAITTLEDK